MATSTPLQTVISRAHTHTHTPLPKKGERNHHMHHIQIYIQVCKHQVLFKKSSYRFWQNIKSCSFFFSKMKLIIKVTCQVIWPFSFTSSGLRVDTWLAVQRCSGNRRRDTRPSSGFLLSIPVYMSRVSHCHPKFTSTPPHCGRHDQQVIASLVHSYKLQWKAMR